MTAFLNSGIDRTIASGKPVNADLFVLSQGDYMELW
jgi:hypothetical protein